nr:WAS/WASL-interacting protein family member 3-like [Aegilops tauschii subsp. strangulata]
MAMAGGSPSGLNSWTLALMRQLPEEMLAEPSSSRPTSTSEGLGQVEGPTLTWSTLCVGGKIPKPPLPAVGFIRATAGFIRAAASGHGASPAPGHPSAAPPPPASSAPAPVAAPVLAPAPRLPPPATSTDAAVAEMVTATHIGQKRRWAGTHVVPSKPPVPPPPPRGEGGETGGESSEARQAGNLHRGCSQAQGEAACKPQARGRAYRDTATATVEHGRSNAANHDRRVR